MNSDPVFGPRAKSLAIDGLNAGLARNDYEMRQAITALNEEFGPRGVETAIAFWCDAVIGHMGGYGRRNKPIALAFELAETGEVETAENVTPEALWAGRVLIARQLLDKDQFKALMSVLPLADDADEYVFTLLSITTLNLAIHLAEHHGADPANADPVNDTPPPQYRPPPGWPAPPPGQSWN